MDAEFRLKLGHVATGLVGAMRLLDKEPPAFEAARQLMKVTYEELDELLDEE